MSPIVSDGPRPAGVMTNRDRQDEDAAYDADAELDLRQRFARTLQRTRIGPFLVFLAAVWFLGSVLLHIAEVRGNQEAFGSWAESLWSVLVIMFSGLEVQPTTLVGRLLALLVLGAGLALVAVLTGAVASTLVEIRFRRRDVSKFEMENHLILCNWAGRGLEWIREVHSVNVQERRPVVIIHDQPDAIDLPDHTDDAAFRDVYIVRGDPTSEVILRRARVQNAHSAVILADDRQGEHADGKSILVCIAMRNVARDHHELSIAVECRNPTNRHHLKKAGADEIISSDELGLRLLARTALYHGMTRAYQELLTVGRNANEMFLLPVPPELVGREFAEVATMLLRYRGDKRSCLLVGVQRDEAMVLNPIGEEAGPLQADDQLVLLSRVIINDPKALPLASAARAPEAAAP
jgi:voltage-gated potassium channel